MPYWLTSGAINAERFINREERQNMQINDNLAESTQHRESKGTGSLGGVEGQSPSWGSRGKAPTKLKCKKTLQ